MDAVAQTRRVSTDDRHPDPGAFRALVRTAPQRWESLHLIHRRGSEVVEARLRHGELDAVWRTDGRVVHDQREPPPLPDAWEIAVDLETGVVVSDHPVGPGTWTGFQNEILHAS